MKRILFVQPALANLLENQGFDPHHDQPGPQLVAFFREAQQKHDDIEIHLTIAVRDKFGAIRQQNALAINGAMIVQEDSIQNVFETPWDMVIKVHDDTSIQVLKKSTE